MSANLFLTHANSYLTDNVKRVYLEELSMMTDADAPLTSLLKQDQSYIAETVRWKVHTSPVDGISHASIGDAGDTEVREASITMKHMFQRMTFDRFSMKVSRDPKAAAIDLLKDGMERAAKNRLRVLENIIVSGDSSAGDIGTIDTGGVTDNGGGSYTLTISAATWASGQFKLRDQLNVDTSSDVFRITAIDLDNRQITVLRDAGGSKVPTAAELLYRQKGKGNEATGLKEIIEGTGSLFGLARAHEWESTKIAMSSAAATEETFIELMMKIFQRSGEYPDLLILSPTQHIRLMRLIKDNQVRNAEAFAERKLANGDRRVFKIPSLTHLNLAGREIKVIAHPSLPAGSAYMVNTKHLELVSVGPGEFMPADNGGVIEYMGRSAQKDQFEALWVYDYAIRCDNPKYHGGFTGAATSLEHIVI